ncbi:MAG: O-antigen ligase family protein [Rhodothermales bacterium]|nr:O-antigen ligase family protein [Rhodothermales bacterium]MBO6781021.1 O-antigen ligase family protein [Rhodothermales bacterium]
MPEYRRWALALYACSLNLESLVPESALGSFSLAKGTGFLYLLSLFPDYGTYLLGRAEAYFWTPLLLFVALFVGSNLANAGSSSVSVLPGVLLLNIAVFVLVLNHLSLDKRAFQWALRGFVLGALIVSVLMVVGVGTSLNADMRLSVFGANENEMGMKLASALAIVGASLAGVGGRMRIHPIAAVGFSGLLLWALVLTGSRSALVVLIAGLLVLGLPRSSTHNRGGLDGSRRQILISLLLLASTLVVVLQSGTLLERLAEIATDGDAGGRLALWVLVLPVIADNWLLGIGATGFSAWSQDLFGATINPHNVLLEVAIYVGALGLLVFGVFLWRVGRAAWEKWSYHGDAVGMVLLSSVAVLLAGNQLLGVKTGWLFLALAAGSHHAQVPQATSTHNQTNQLRTNINTRQPNG